MVYIHDDKFDTKENDFESLEIFFTSFHGEGLYRTRDHKIFKCPKGGSLSFGKSDDGFYLVSEEIYCDAHDENHTKHYSYNLMHVFHTVVRRRTNY